MEKRAGSDEFGSDTVSNQAAVIMAIGSVGCIVRLKKGYEC